LWAKEVLRRVCVREIFAHWFGKGKTNKSRLCRGSGWVSRSEKGAVRVEVGDSGSVTSLLEGNIWVLWLGYMQHFDAVDV
jgi:hypothetical protein